MAAGTTPAVEISSRIGKCQIKNTEECAYRVNGNGVDWIHTDAVYSALINAAGIMEERLQESLKNYQEHPDVQANLQQLQYDLQSWNLALTTMTNIQKNMADALNSIANNFK